MSSVSLWYFVYGVLFIDKATVEVQTQLVSLQQYEPNPKLPLID